VSGLFEGALRLQEQVEQNWHELALSAFRAKIPIYHRERYYTFYLDPAERNNTPAAFTHFDNDLATFLPFIRPVDNVQPGGANLTTEWTALYHRYGKPNPTKTYYKLPLSNVVSINSIVDDVTNPTITLFPGKDFRLFKDSVEFFEDPCKDGKPRTWFLTHVEQDFRWIFKHFGVLLNLESSSSHAYRSVVDNIFNAYIDGASSTNIFTILSEVTGNVIAKEKETVVATALWSVITDKNDYVIPAGHKVAVEIGDVLQQGDPITAEFKPIYLNQLAQPDEVSAILIPRRFLGVEYFYGLVFANEYKDIYEVGDQKRFPVEGNRFDVERFWQDFEKHCQLHGTSVNEVIELCQKQSNEIQINPYRFFAEHIGRYHFTLLKLDYVKYPTDLNLDHLPIRRLTPPWSALLIQQCLELPDEITILGESNDDIALRGLGILETGYRVRDKLKSMTIHLGRFNRKGWCPVTRE